MPTLRPGSYHGSSLRLTDSRSTGDSRSFSAAQPLLRAQLCVRAGRSSWPEYDVTLLADGTLRLARLAARRPPRDFVANDDDGDGKALEELEREEEEGELVDLCACAIAPALLLRDGRAAICLGPLPAAPDAPRRPASSPSSSSPSGALVALRGRRVEARSEFE